MVIRNQGGSAEMKINNNIMALNAHRQLTANNAGGARSMEKLSSGLRINRAGDDAAGLAISEKMRNQVRGLRQSMRNAQDGISLIQTAEGALGESHSMLQRVRELTVQAANDTNVGIDREQIQREINQLSSEMNRIGNATEFNTQKILNGGGARTIDGDLGTSTTGSLRGAVSTMKTVTDSVVAKSTGQNTYTANDDITDIVITALANDVGQDLDGKTIKFDVTAAGAPGTDTNTVSVSTNANEIEIAIVHDAANLDTATVTLADIQSAIDSQGSLPTKFSLSEAGGGLTLDLKSLNNVEIGPLAGGEDAAVQGVYQFDLTTAFANAGDDFVINVGGSAYTLTAADVALLGGGMVGGSAFAIGDEINGWKTIEEQATSIASIINDSTDLGSIYKATSLGTRIVLTELAGQEQGVAPVRGTVAALPRSGVYDLTITSQVDIGGRYTIDGVDIVITDDNNHGGLANGTAILVGADVAEQVANLKTAIELNTSLNVKYDVSGSAGTVINFIQEGGHESPTAPVVTTSDQTASGFQARFQIGANSAQDIIVEIGDTRALALGMTSSKSGESVDVGDGLKAYYVEVVNVNDGMSATSTEYALDVTSHEKATAALRVIDGAIEKVSNERSKLGAYQNRLEHSIANLGASSENLQAAESRIRDLDMAEEMMEFTKNNILQQAATAMLAQANMAPQTVLQLLG